ncbi:MAG: hypothetical protein M3540_13185 [Actinomycetota bacterium]|nr:hypothetical protein [Actinomycetota bacterium]
MKLNNYPGFTLDAIERVAWTAIQFAAGGPLDYLIEGQITWRGGFLRGRGAPSLRG